MSAMGGSRDSSADGPWVVLEPNFLLLLWWMIFDETGLVSGLAVVPAFVRN